MRVRLGIGAAMLAALLLIVLPSCVFFNGTAEDNEKKKNDYRPAPAFEGKDLFSEELVKFPNDLEGEVVYLNFFSLG